MSSTFYLSQTQKFSAQVIAYHQDSFLKRELNSSVALLCCCRKFCLIGETCADEVLLGAEALSFCLKERAYSLELKDGLTGRCLVLTI